MKNVSKRTTGLMVSAVGLLVVFAIVLKGKCDREEPLAQFCIRISNAIKDGDSGTLWRSMDPDEQKASGLNQRQFAQLVEWYKTCMASYRVQGPPTVELNKDDLSADCTMAFSNGTLFQPVVEFFAVRTEDGPKVRLTGALIYGGMTARYEPKFPGEAERVRRWMAVRTGTAAESGAFASMGLRGVVRSNPGGELITWKQLSEGAAKGEAIARQNLERAREKLLQP